MSDQALPSSPIDLSVVPAPLLQDLRTLIETARDRAAAAINMELVLLHWHVGDRIRREILQEERAAYGKQIVAALSNTLTTEYGRGFSRQSLFHMIQFAEIFPDAAIVSTLSRQLTFPIQIPDS